MKTRQSKKFKLARLILISVLLLSFMINKLFKGESLYGIKAYIWILLFFIALLVDLKVNNFYRE